MGQVTSLFVRKVIDQVNPVADKVALFASVGLDPTAPVDPSLMVSDSSYYELLKTVSQLDPNATELPLKAGASMRCDDYGAFGLAWRSAPNLRASYERAERYALVLTSTATYELCETREGVYLQLHREGDRHIGLRMSNEATIASIVAISQQVSKETFQPRSVYFKHSSPKFAAAHERYFGCPVHFDADKDALLVAPEALLQPNRLSDTGFSRFLDSHLASQVSQASVAPPLWSYKFKKKSRKPSVRAFRKFQTLRDAWG